MTGISHRDDLAAGAAERRSRMVEAMLTTGELVSPAWQLAFARVPRHVFIPAFHDCDRLVGGAEAARQEEWMDAVHDPERTLITQRSEGGVPTSSGTMPSLIAYMLEALDVRDSHRILHVGTGTGYTDALLAERLGDDRVTTMDIHPDLTGLARVRLGEAGYRPEIVTGDGALGHSRSAPYDRVVATCSVRRIPASWLAQTRLGGKILTPLAGGFAVVTVSSPEHACGRFLDSPAYFMPLRSAAADPGQGTPIPEEDAFAGGAARPARLGATETVYDNSFRFLLELAEPGLAYGRSGPSREHLTVASTDGAIARLDQRGPGRWTVTQAGPRRLWDAIEALHDLWSFLERPTRTRFVVTLGPDGQNVSLDEGGRTRTWSL